MDPHLLREMAGVVSVIPVCRGTNIRRRQEEE
jgi:hypothetical protein